MDHTVERTITISLDKEEALVLALLLQELSIHKDDSNDWTDIEEKIMKDMRDILAMY